MIKVVILFSQAFLSHKELLCAFAPLREIILNKKRI
jgi:hypothetical protein